MRSWIIALYLRDYIWRSANYAISRVLVIKNCWGLDDEILSTAHICRRMNYLSIEGCSRLTIVGLESVILSWNELESLNVKSFNNVKDSEISLTLVTLFSLLKDFK